MKRKKIKLMAMFLVLVMSMGLLSACGSTKTDNEAMGTENTDSEVQEVVDTEPEITYEEKESYFEMTDSSDFDRTYVDDTTMDWSVWDRIGTTIHLKDSINIYSWKKEMVGYTKPDIEVLYVSANGEWSHIVFSNRESGAYVRTQELENAMTIVENEVDTGNETNKEEETTNLPTYTVTDMTKTMYAKQSVNLRSGPSTDYDKVGSLTTNQEVTVTGQADTGWYRISYNGGEAFVSNTYLSDTKVEIPTSPDDGDNTDEDENDSEEEYTPPTDDVIIEEPTYTYTVDEVIAIVRSTMESNGIMWSLDYAPPEAIEEFGPDLGMGWGMDWVPMDDPYTYANSMVEGSLYQGFNLYYIEYQYVENGCVVLKTYYGTQ